MTRTSGSSADWLEVSLSVNGELAEAVAEVLSRFAPNGVMTEQGIRHRNDEAEGTPDGPIIVRAYLPADSALEQRRTQVEEALHYLSLIRPLPMPTYRLVANANWMEAWKEHYQPILIGRRLMVLPAWLNSEESERVAVKIDPGMAFGTGTHPSTQLCLEFLDELLGPDLPALGFIDVGCGSGILSIAAIKLGVRTALGVDIDAEAIMNARTNADLNGIGPQLVFAQGSVKDILDRRFLLNRAPLVAANILAPVIIGLLDDHLVDILLPAGRLILSGILVGQEADVLRACGVHGLRQVARRQCDDWVALCVAA